MSLNLYLIYSLFLSIVVAAPLEDLQQRSGKVFGLDFNVERVPLNSTGILDFNLDKREVSLDLKNLKVKYMADLEIGSNLQKVSVNIDTGSADLWVPDVSSGNPNPLSNGGYDPSNSTTSHNTNELFYIQYVDGTASKGYFYTDDIKLSGGAVLKGFQFGDATTTSKNSQSGTFGIGKEALEAPVQFKMGKRYTNFPTALKEQGYTDKAAFSLYLNSPDAASGNILFGGKDLAKIDGNLVTFPMVGDAARDSITLDSISIEGGQQWEANTDYTLDSGSSFTHLPRSIQKQIVSQFKSFDGETYQGMDIVYCPPQNTTIDFNFNGVTISIPYADYTIPVPVFSDLCLLTILPRDDDVRVLGDNFLRHAYIVFDYEADTISLGKVNVTGETNIVPL